MSEARNQPQAEKPQQELRFGLRDPIADEAAAALEKRPSENLFLFSARKIKIDTSDQFEGTSQNLSEFLQYRKAVESLANNGQRQFQLEPWMTPMFAGGPGGRLAAIALRVHLDPLISDTILARPLYGINSRPHMTKDEVEKAKRENDILEAARSARFLPVIYTVQDTISDPAGAIVRFEHMLGLGMYVSQLRVVPSYPQSARMKDLYPHEPKIDRTMERIDARMPKRAQPSAQLPTEPIDITPEDDASMRDAS